MDLQSLRRLVLQGEGSQLEFKRKARHPEKIAREFVAFANTAGGNLLVGVDDDGTLYGSKNPEGEHYVISRFLAAEVGPGLRYEMQRIPVSARREVLSYRIRESLQKPLYVREGEARRVYVRVADMSVQASREMVRLLRLQGEEQGVSLRFGEPERTLLRHLEQHPHITLSGTQHLLQTSRRQASLKLILMVRAGLLTIQPTAKGDHFSLNPQAFD
jgi:hypothetical protein